MNKVIPILLFILLVNFSFAQKISNIDFDAIQLRTKDSTSNFYFPHLSNRIKNLDTTLTFLEFEHLYYGQVFSEKYNPYGSSDDQQEFIKKFRAKNYAEAIPIGRKILDENPINLGIIYRMLVCHHYTSDLKIARKYGRIYFDMLDVIYASGDGKSHKTAFVVTNVSDEYDITNDMELQVLSQALSDETDILTIRSTQEVQGSKKNKKGKQSQFIYFNVSKPLGQLNHMFKKEE